MNLDGYSSRGLAAAILYDLDKDFRAAKVNSHVASVTCHGVVASLREFSCVIHFPNGSQDTWLVRIPAGGGYRRVRAVQGSATTTNGTTGSGGGVTQIASKIFGYKISACKPIAKDIGGPSAKAVWDCSSGGADGYVLIERQNGSYYAGN